MRLPKEDADLFFRLMWGLQFYVNQQLQLQPGIQSAERYGKLPSAEKLKVRDALWKNPQLIDAYAVANPDHLSAAEKDIVSGWRHFVAGDFYIYRFLKTYTVFMGKGQVYGVLGLYDSLEEVFGGHPLPVMVEAVLLPFKRRIIYDGLLRSYSVYFGGGIRSGLHEDYMKAKQNGRIITELGGVEIQRPGQTAAEQPRADWGEHIEAALAASEHLRGGTAVQAAAFGLLRASAKAAEEAARGGGDLEDLWRATQRAQRALRRLQTVLERMED